MTAVAADSRTGSDGGAAPAKETGSLPAPATMSDDQAGQAGMGQRLAWILQYLNPLFYARLAQSLVSSVFHSYQITDGNAARQLSAPVTAEATAIDCGYTDAAGGATRLTALPQLDLGPSDLPIEPHVAQFHVVETVKTVEPIEAYTDGGMFKAAGMAESVEEAEAFEPEAPASTSSELEATPDAAPANGSTEHKTGKKGKRGKNKNKAKAAGPTPA